LWEKLCRHTPPCPKTWSKSHKICPPTGAHRAYIWQGAAVSHARILLAPRPGSTAERKGSYEAANPTVLVEGKTKAEDRGRSPSIRSPPTASERGRAPTCLPTNVIQLPLLSRNLRGHSTGQKPNAKLVPARPTLDRPDSLFRRAPGVSCGHSPPDPENRPGIPQATPYMLALSGPDVRPAATPVPCRVPPAIAALFACDVTVEGEELALLPAPNRSLAAEHLRRGRPRSGFRVQDRRGASSTFLVAAPMRRDHLAGRQARHGSRQPCNACRAAPLTRPPRLREASVPPLPAVSAWKQLRPRTTRTPTAPSSSQTSSFSSDSPPPRATAPWCSPSGTGGGEMAQEPGLIATLHAEAVAQRFTANGCPNAHGLCRGRRETCFPKRRIPKDDPNGMGACRPPRNNFI